MILHSQDKKLTQLFHNKWASLHPPFCLIFEQVLSQIAPLKKNPLKRKTPPTTVTMADKVNTTPHTDAIDLQDLVVDAQ